MNIENIDCDSKSKVLSLAVFELLINCIFLNFCSDSFPHKHIHDNDSKPSEWEKIESDLGEMKGK